MRDLDFSYLYNNPHSRDRWMVELKIDHFQKAIDNLGKDGMQHIYISAHPQGVSKGMECGKYVDLSNQPFVYAGIKKALEKMLEIQKEILSEINADS